MDMEKNKAKCIRRVNVDDDEEEKEEEDMEKEDEEVLYV